jgi:UDP-N-acetylglucosamine 2-epimerase (non-hydrolysing)
LSNICSAVKILATKYPHVSFVFPVHPNPNVTDIVYTKLNDISNIYLIDPLCYEEFLYLMKRSYIILTDSGGIQEEAPSLGKPVLVTRSETERSEAVAAGTVRLVGTSKDAIIMETSRLLDDPEEYGLMSNAHNPYGDGLATQRIMQHLMRVI